jgi:5'-3' exonuclease
MKNDPYFCDNMGIPSYFRVIVRAYPTIISEKRPVGVTHYFLDYNGIVHQAAHGLLRDPPADIERAIMTATWDYTKTCIDSIDPSQLVSICMDGVAPVAKMLQQRRRRYIGIFQNRLDGVTAAWDRNAISPGTPFMARLRAYVQAQLRNREDTGRTYHFSSADEAGEGEHKIFHQIRGLPQDTSSVVVHGLDADLIMLSLLSHHPRIWLMRESDDGGFIYLSVGELRKALLQELLCKYKWPEGDESSIIETYITLCFLLGNDFLPHMPNLHLRHGGHERLLEIAADAIRAADGYPSTEWDMHRVITAIFCELSKNEDREMFEMVEKYMKNTPRGGETTLPSDLYAIRPENKDPLANVLYALPQIERWRPHYYKHMFHARMHDTSVVLSVCRTFVKGIYWTSRYYKHQANDPRWHYPWGYAPSLRDLANFCAGITAEEFKEIVGSGAAPPGTGFVDPETQLLCIMPPQSAPILPKAVREGMKRMPHLFPINYRVQTFLKTHLWECMPVLPHLEI